MQETRQIKQIIGSNIRRRRDELGRTRLELAQDLAGIAMPDTRCDPNDIYRWESGRHRPSDEMLELLAKVLGRDVGWLSTDHDKVAA